MKPLKALFCGQAKMVKELGASKVIIELTDEMAELGWDCKLLAPADLEGHSESSGSRYAERLHSYLMQNSGSYDVIDYDHEYLPFPRSDFNPNTLMVARSVLLLQHLETIKIPHGRSLKSTIGRIFKSGQRRKETLNRVHDADLTVAQADLVNVSNYDDKAELIRRGIDAEKIAVIPYGLSRTRMPKFDTIPSDIPNNQPIIAFVGTFDYRKGAREFAEIVHSVVKRVYNARFRLLGCKGMMRTEADVLACFPDRLHKYLDIKMTFASDELPALLAPCWAGVFPSHLEGFGFGVLEMMAASMPVIAYNAPGPPMMLPDSCLVPPGNWWTIADKLAELLQNREQLQAARLDAKQRAFTFTWEKSAAETDRLYRKLLEEKRAPASHRVGNAS
jgi:glycosyltransferase involved in cell wall biosynthesis